MGSCPDTDIDPKRPGLNENGYIFSISACWIRD